MKHYFLTVLLLLSAIYITAQNGSISGSIKDKEMNNEPLPFANVFIKGTTKGTTTDMEGNYSIENIAPGTYTLTFSFVGYETLEKNNIVVQAGKETKVDAVLGAGSVSLQEVILEVETNRENENVLLLEQKKAVVAKQAIGAKELSRKGVSDAQGAVTKISGVSKQEGVKNVFIRGLGDRYNSTTLNGFPIPSEDPEYKNISLGFFGTDIIQNIGVDKVFSTGGIGDVGGANIDISSKELSGNSALQLDLSLGVNSQALKADNFLEQDGVGYFGFANSKQPTDGKHDFTNKLDPKKANTPLNHSYGISGGKKFYLGDNPLSTYFVASHSIDYSFTDEIVRNTNTIGDVFIEKNGKKYTQNTNQLVLGNATYRVNGKYKLAYNLMLVHNNSQYVADYDGSDSEMYQGAYDGSSGFMRRQQSNDNKLIVNQLLSEWKLSKNTDLDVGIAFNRVIGDEPDRRTNNLTRSTENAQDGKNFSLTGSTGRHTRYFITLKENDLNAKATLSKKIRLKDEDDRVSRIKFGYNGRMINDDFNAIEYNFDIHDRGKTFSLDNLNLDSFFNQESLDNGKIAMDKNFDSYTVNKNIHSGFIGLTYQLTPKFIADLGVSADNVDLKVNYNVIKGSQKGSTSIKKTFVLPNLNLKYDLAEKHSLRFGASKTYTLPQSKEISPYQYIGVTFKSQGNKNLQPSQNYNFDLKWDYYLSPSELFTVTLFQKYIQDPIARVEEGNSGGYLTYKNIASSATVAGIEFEMRKNLFQSEEDRKNKLSLGLNAAYLYSNLEIDVLNTEKRDSQLEGAAPFLANLDVTHHYNGFTNSLVLNYFSDRIYTIGTTGFNDIVEKGVIGLDFVSSAKLSEHLSIKLKASNLLDPTYELTRESTSGSKTVILNSYKKGINVSLGLSYEF